MGCSPSNIESLVIVPVEKKSPSPPTFQRPSSTQQSNRIMENCIVVWLLHDSSMDVENEKNRLQQVVSFIKIFSDSNECVNYINSVRIEKIFLILPIIDSLLDSIQSLPQIEKIYIFNSSFHEIPKHKYQYLSSDSFSDIGILCKQLQTDVELCELDLIEITASAVSIPDGIASIEFKKQEAYFLYVQLMRELLFRLKFERNAKTEFVNFFRIHYSNNEEQLRLIDDFNANYRPQKALQWLTRQCFIRKALQRIQRTPEIDIHYKIAFFVKDVYTQLNIFQENNSFIAKNKWIVYRGKTMFNDRFDLLMKNNSGGLLSFSGFFKANTDKQIAIDFVSERLLAFPHVVGILFEIHIDPTIRSTRSPLASFNEIQSDDSFEKNGILFGMYTVFRIQSVEQITEKSLTMWTVKLILITDDNPQLLRIVSPLRSSEVHANPLSHIGKFFMDRGDYEHAEQFFLGMLQDTIVLNQPHRLARLHKGLGTNYMNKGEYAKALEHYQQSLQVSLSYLPSTHTDLASLYNGIGNSYYKQGHYFEALQNYEKAVHLFGYNQQLMNDQFVNDLNSRIDTTKKLINHKS